MPQPLPSEHVLPETTAPATGLWSPPLRLTTVGLVLTVTLVAFEALAVITILPVISGDLGGIGLYGWVISAFSLGSLFGIVVAGEQTDRHGPAAPFVAGLVLFAAGLVIGGLAPTMLVLVMARALQGIGAGAIPSVAYASIGRTYPEALHPRVFAILSTAWVVPGLIGPSVAALVAVHLGWRWVFLGLVPVVLVVGGATVIPLRRIGAPATAHQGPSRALDAIRVTAGAGLLLAGLGARSAPVALALLVAAALVGVRPLLRLLPPGTLRAAAGLPAAVLSRGLLTFAFFGADTFIPLTLISARGQSAAVASVAVTAATLSWTTGAWVQERNAATWGAQRLVGWGFGLLLLGISVVALLLVPQVPIAVGIAGWLLGGLGIGIAYAQVSIAVLRDAPPGQEGASSASMQLCDNLGVALGAGLGGVPVAVGSAMGWRPEAGIGAAFAFAAAASVAGLAASRRLSSVATGNAAGPTPGVGSS
jgi:MFS family permease